jgi:hypothetical protein
MRIGVAERVLDEDGNIIGQYKYTKGSSGDFRVTHRSPITKEDLTYIRSSISGTLNDGRKFKGHSDRVPGLINETAFEQKYGLPGSIIDVKFGRR